MPKFQNLRVLVQKSCCGFVWLGFLFLKKIFFSKHREVVGKITILEIALCMVIVVFNFRTFFCAAQCRAGLGMNQELSLF